MEANDGDQNIEENSLGQAVIRMPRHHHITPILISLHWLKFQECIHFKVLSITYNTLQSSQPTYLREVFTIQPTRSTNHPPVLPFLDPGHFSSQVLQRSHIHHSHIHHRFQKDRRGQSSC